ncbi:sugar ABC transporter permease [Humidisolicoccus flavus]|uniref:sugar ABC transporter permease n=1 Tax=Humidisolicoccus flavus TaxID=3111414 RepID=UPI003245A098
MTTTTQSQGTGRAGEFIPTKRAFNFKRWFFDTGWRHVIGVIASVYAILPLLYIFSASLNPNGTLTGSNALFSAIGFDSYARILSSETFPFATWFANSLIVGLVTAAGTVFLGALAAYSFSRMRFRGRRVGLMSLIVVQMFPQLLAVVAVFLLVTRLGDIVPWLGVNSHAALIAVYLGGALGVNTYLMYGFFNTVPSSIDEAAKLDGAGHARIFFTIILRLVAPILAVVGLLSFIATMNDFVIASVILVAPEKQTLAVGLYQMVSNPNYADWSAFAAGAIMAAAPVVALFLFLQKYIVGGLTAGSVK